MTVRPRQVVITGVTSGIGSAAACELARRGANIALIGRNPPKLSEIAHRLRAVAAESEITEYVADLADLDQVSELAARLRDELPTIDVLVNNAGMVARRAKQTRSGHDHMLTTNYLGPFLLTELLAAVLGDSAPSRIVITGSEAHRIAGPFDPERFEHLGQYQGRLALARYGRTKLLDLLWADDLARKFEGTGVAVNSLCPGMVGTPLWRESPVLERLTRLASVSPLVRTPEQGARMLVHLADDLSPERTGGFYTSTPGAWLLPVATPRRDPAIAARVYERSRELVVDYLPDAGTKRSECV